MQRDELSGPIQLKDKKQEMLFTVKCMFFSGCLLHASCERHLWQRGFWWNEADQLQSEISHSKSASVCTQTMTRLSQILEWRTSDTGLSLVLTNSNPGFHTFILKTQTCHNLLFKMKGGFWKEPSIIGLVHKCQVVPICLLLLLPVIKLGQILNLQNYWNTKLTSLATAVGECVIVCILARQISSFTDFWFICVPPGDDRGW